MTRLPDLDVLGRRHDGVGLSLGNGCVARLGIVGSVATDAANWLVGRYLVERLWQHGEPALESHPDGVAHAQRDAQSLREAGLAHLEGVERLLPK